jgi:hypothetical protein
MILNRRGLSVVSQCFFQILLVYTHHQQQQQQQQHHSDNSISNHSSQISIDVCSCILILTHLCKTATSDSNRHQFIVTWHQRGDVCKRVIISLVNFHSNLEIRTQCFQLLRSLIAADPVLLILHCIQFLHAGYLNNNHVNFLMSSCSNIPAANTTKMTLCCQAGGSNVMGAYFPVFTFTKKQTAGGQQTQQGMAGGGKGLGATKLICNIMCMPIQFVAHSHLNGAIVLFSGSGVNVNNNISEYEKQLCN